MTYGLEKLFDMSYPRRMYEIQRLGPRYVDLYERLEACHEALACYENKIDECMCEIKQLETEWVTEAKVIKAPK